MSEADPGFSRVETSIVEFRKMLRASKEMFIEYFLADELGNAPVVDFHLMVFDRFTDLSVPRDVAALPRDHAKTTYLRLAYAYLIAFSPLEFFVPMGPTKDSAAFTMQVVWSIISSTEYTQVFGPVEVSTMRPSEGLIQGKCFWYDENDVQREKLLIIKAQGAQQQVRGMNIFGLRPQFVGCDDIEDEEAVRTEEGYLKFKTWFDNTFMRAVSKEKGKNKVAQIGNLVATRTLLNDNLNDPDWRSVRLGILRMNGQPLWPGYNTLESIKKDFLSAQRRGQLSGWFGELMNMPLNLANSLVNYEKIAFSPVRNPADGITYLSFITIDPAGDGEASDEFAIVLHTIDPIGVPQVTEYVHARGMKPAQAVEEIKRLCFRWDCHVIGCESVQLQKVFLDYFKLSFEVDGLQDYQFVPIMLSGRHKTARLRVFASALETGEYTLAEGDWDMLNQLLQFDVRIENNLDDLIDAGAMGLIMLRDYRTEIMDQKVGQLTVPMPPAQPGSTNI